MKLRRKRAVYFISVVALSFIAIVFKIFHNSDVTTVYLPVLWNTRTETASINNVKMNSSGNINKGNSAETTSSTYSKTTKHIASSSLRVDIRQDEAKCPEFYKIAREMLDGAKIKLPHETNQTRWTFKKRIDLNTLEKTSLRWNSPWNQGDSTTTRQRLQRYNVTADTITDRRKYMLTYAHGCCRDAKKRAVHNAIHKAKMDYAEALDRSALSKPFQISHQEILRRGRGGGYWLWKSYIILKTLLTKLNDGDLLLYQDADMYFLKDAGPLLKLCMESAGPNILTFENAYPEGAYNKRDAYVLMDMDNPRVYKKGQIQRMGGLLVMMKNCETIQFFMEYLAYSSDPRINTDDKNVLGLPNLPGFIENRHDQTVLSLLSKKWGCLALRDPCKLRRNGLDVFETFYKYASGPYHWLYSYNPNKNIRLYNESTGLLLPGLD